MRAAFLSLVVLLWSGVAPAKSLSADELTLQADADLASTKRHGGTAPIPACHHGHVETVILGDGEPTYVEITRLLIAQGGDVDLAVSRGVTPLAHARQRGYREIASILETAGAR